jgi:SAM-dependent methyltransferase
MAINENKLHQLLDRALVDLGGAVHAALMSIGDELGLYKALAKGPQSSAELARNTQTDERYIREWLNNQAAGGYVTYDKTTANYSLSEEQELCLTNPAGPVDLPGAALLAQDFFHIRDRAVENFRTGKGMEWGEHHPCLFCGTERFFRAGYNSNLLSSWIPALDGVQRNLKRGGKVADVGCGHGASTILLAKAFPRSEFVGYDYHRPSIDIAVTRAQEAGVANARFEVADAAGYQETDFDLIAFFDCLHDMGDPTGVARHARRALKSGGVCMLVEPFANDDVADNLNPLGRLSYGASCLICVPVSLARNGPALGAQAGERRLREIMVDEAGFSAMRRAAETPFNIVLEAKP